MFAEVKMKQAAEEKWLTHYPFKVDIAGSIPVGSTKDG